MHKDQYSVVASRRQGYDVLLWHTPALAVAAQSFLLAAALSAEFSILAELVLSVSAIFVGLASLQLFVRLRYLEKYDSELLMRFEQSAESEGYAVVHGPRWPITGMEPGLFGKIRSYYVWVFILIVLVALSVWIVAISMRELWILN